MFNSVDIVRAAISLAITTDKISENKEIDKLKKEGIRTVVLDVTGNFTDSTHIIIEKAIIQARENGLTEETHVEESAVAGAAREAIVHVASKATGLHGSGKIAICRYKEHLSVCIFMCIGLLNLNEVAIGLGHRAVPYDPGN